MRFILRAIALIAPVFAAASLGAAQRAGVLRKDHISQAEAIGFIVLCAIAGLVLLFATRKRDTSQQQRSGRQRPAARQRSRRRQSTGYGYPWQ